MVKAFNTTFAGTLLNGEVKASTSISLMADDDPAAAKEKVATGLGWWPKVGGCWARRADQHACEAGAIVSFRRSFSVANAS